MAQELNLNAPGEGGALKTASIQISIAVLMAVAALWERPARADITPFLPKKTMVEIVDYDSEMEMFSISSKEYHGYGQLYVRIDELVKAVSSLKEGRLRQHPSSIVSNVYQLDRDIDVIDLVAPTSDAPRSPATSP